ncbi:MAG: histidine phosphatase family protein [Anaerolineae bacterium]|nr:histidine phosphatase family protein [Anaerolineae bacterium]
MNLIYVMRHAQSTINLEHRITGRTFDGDLTPLGREQAAIAGEWLADKGITKISHSPFHRAAQTAQIIADRLRLQATTDAGLGEMNCGDLDWRTDEASWDAWRAVYERWQQRDWKATYPGGESYQQGFDRFNRCLMNVQANETALLVTHGGISVTVIPYLCVNAAALHGNLTLDHTGIIVLEPYGDGRYICRAWNQSEHLQTGRAYLNDK